MQKRKQHSSVSLRRPQNDPRGGTDWAGPRLNVPTGHTPWSHKRATSRASHKGQTWAARRTTSQVTPTRASLVGGDSAGSHDKKAESQQENNVRAPSKRGYKRAQKGRPRSPALSFRSVPPATERKSMGIRRLARGRHAPHAPEQIGLHGRRWPRLRPAQSPLSDGARARFTPASTPAQRPARGGVCGGVGGPTPSVVGCPTTALQALRRVGCAAASGSTEPFEAHPSSGRDPTWRVEGRV